MHDCTLSVTVASTDLPFLHLTLPHIVRASRFAFAHRMVLADVDPPSAEFLRRPGGSAEELARFLDDLVRQRVIDEWVPVGEGSPATRDAWQGRLRRRPPHLRDYRGSPIASYLLSFALCPTRFLAHLDGDMLVHQPADAPSWIERGIELLEAHADVGAVLPRSGPPHPDGRLRQRRSYVRDARGFFRFASFTSRLFLVERARVERLYPLSTRWPWRTPPGRRLGNLLARARGRSTLPTWETMIERGFGDAELCRADLPGPGWSLHPHARGDEFVRLLPAIIEAVEAGRFPPAQAGRYNMDFDAWRGLLAPAVATPRSPISNRQVE